MEIEETEIYLVTTYEHCTACPFGGGCVQCGGTGKYEVIREVSGNNIKKKYPDGLKPNDNLIKILDIVNGHLNISKCISSNINVWSTLKLDLNSLNDQADYVVAKTKTKEELFRYVVNGSVSFSGNHQNLNLLLDAIFDGNKHQIFGVE